MSFQRVFITFTCFAVLFLTACKQSAVSSPTADTIYQSCLEVFKKKGDPMGVGAPMCESMRASCEEDIQGDSCKKAQRIIGSN